MQTRKALPADIPGISAMLKELADAGIRTLPHDADYVRDNYVANPNGVICSLAVSEGGEILGLQAISRAVEGNPYGVAPGWGIVGTHVSPRAKRLGVGKALFAANLEVASRAGLTALDAYIGETNEGALAYYEAMGFRSYRTMPGRICKRYDFS